MLVVMTMDTTVMLMVITKVMMTTRISVHRPVLKIVIPRQLRLHLLRFQIKTPLAVNSVARHAIDFVVEVLGVSTSFL